MMEVLLLEVENSFTVAPGGEDGNDETKQSPSLLGNLPVHGLCATAQYAKMKGAKDEINQDDETMFEGYEYTDFHNFILKSKKVQVRTVQAPVKCFYSCVNTVWSEQVTAGQFFAEAIKFFQNS